VVVLLIVIVQFHLQTAGSFIFMALRAVAKLQRPQSLLRIDDCLIRLSGQLLPNLNCTLTDHPAFVKSLRQLVHRQKGFLDLETSA